MNRSSLFVAALIIFATVPTLAQDFQQGFVPYQSYDINKLDSINLSSGNLVVDIPVISYPQRGALPSIGYSLLYNNTTWISGCSDNGYGVITSCQIYPSTSVNLVTNELQNAEGVSGGVVGSLNYGFVTTGGPVLDASGAIHGALTTTSSPWPYVTTDATGMKETESGSGLFTSQYFVTDANGIKSTSQFPCSGCDADVLTSIQDPTGANTITLTYGAGPNEQLAGISDSIGRSIPPFPASATATCVTEDFPIVSGGTASYQACYQTYTLDSNLGLTSENIYDYSGTVVMLHTLTLPNNTTWTFDYDNYGDLTAITLPTGGQIRYSWSIPSWAGYFLDSESPYTVARQVASRTIDPAPPSTGDTWNYSYSGYNNSTTTVTDQDGDQTIHTFGYADDFEIETQYYNSSSTLVQTVYKTFFGYPTTYPYMDIVPKTVETYWNAGGQENEICYIYDDNTNTNCAGTDAFNSSGPTFYDYGSSVPLVYGSQLYKYEYDYGSSAPGSLERQTQTTYMWSSNGSYLNANLLSVPSELLIENGSGIPARETTYAYDESGYAPAGCSSSNPCGFPTTTNNYVTPSASLTSHTQYTSYGMPASQIDPAGNPTTTTYDSTGEFPSEIQYPSTSGVTHTESFQYDSSTGLLLNHWDQNNQETRYSYDNMGRLLTIIYPDTGSATFNYAAGDNNQPNPYFTFTRSITSGINLTQLGMVDGLARQEQIRTQVPSSTCPGGYSYVVTTYENEGRTGSVSNPECTSTPSDPTSYQYDPVNRVTKVTEPDGSTITTSYTGSYATTTDEAGHKRQSYLDGIGNMTKVFEDPSGSDYQTLYSYDANNNLTSVNQSGLSRAFQYDMLSRLTLSTNPESGSTTYSYVTSAGRLCAGANSAVCYRTDANSKTTTYSYDALNRLTQKSYSDSTPTVTYLYDGSTMLPSGCTIGSFSYGSYLKPNRTAMCDAAGSEAWNYDPMGRAITDQRTLNTSASTSVTYTATYGYNLDSSISSIIYPSGRTITYAPNIVPNEPLSAIDNANGINFATNAVYTPAGNLGSLKNGSNIVSTFIYNNRLQLCRLAVQTTGNAPASCSDSNTGNVLDLAYNSNLGAGDNGNVVAIANNINTNRSQSFGYDSLNRLLTAQTTATAATDSTDCWGESYQYDNDPYNYPYASGPWGNLTNINVLSSSYNGCVSENLQATVNSQNQISVGSPFTYDYAGNLTAVPGAGGATYTYNAENQLTQASGTSTAGYVYDGDGKRVEKTAGGTPYKLYWFDLSGNVLDETDQTGSTTNSSFNEYIFFNGTRIARFGD